MLQGKTALITGASSGIGRAVAQKLVKEGAKVVANGRNEDALKNLSEEIGCGFIVADITKDGECERLVKEATQSLGGLTTLINCAGVLKGGAFGSIDLDNFNFNFRANTQSVFEMMTHSIPHLKEGEGACIVNVSSVNGKHPFAGCASYCASKAAVDMMTRCAAVDLAPFGIRCIGINPGVVETNLQKAGGLDDEQYANFLKRSVETTHPIAQSRGSVGQPEEVADLISFMVSEKAGFITGECIAIDGGRQCVGAR